MSEKVVLRPFAECLPNPDLEGLLTAGERALTATAPESVSDREVAVRDALRRLMMAVAPSGRTFDLDTK